MRPYPMLAAAVAATLAFAGAAHADYPDRPIRYLLHVSPGGGTDLMARKLGIQLQQILGQPVVIENRAGGRGASQMAELTRAKSDGYTIGAVTNTHISAFHQTLRHYSINSIDWIAKLVYEPYIVVVGADSPYKSMKDLVAGIRAKPGSLDIAGFVRGSGSHVAWEMMMDAAHLKSRDVNWVPYDSVSDAVTAVLGGHGAVTVAYVDLVKDHVAAGNLRVIGVMSDKRLADMPDVPTLKEQGLDVDSSWEQWRGVIGPHGMPADVKKKLADAIEKIMQSDDMKKYIHDSSLVADFEGPEQFTEFAKQQDKVTVDWLKNIGMLK